MVIFLKKRVAIYYFLLYNEFELNVIYSSLFADKIYCNEGATALKYS